MDKLKLLSALTATILAVGCTTTSNKKPSRADYLSGQHIILSLNSKGQSVFQCTYDSVGFYWKYLRSEGKLTNSNHKEVGKLTPSGLVLYPNKSFRMTPLLSTPRKATDLTDTLFQIYSNQEGSPQYVERIKAQGGMPLIKCAPAQRDGILKVPFSAKYVFYK